MSILWYDDNKNQEAVNGYMRKRYRRGHITDDSIKELLASLSKAASTDVERIRATISDVRLGNIAPGAIQQLAAVDARADDDSTAGVNSQRQLAIHNSEERLQLLDQEEPVPPSQPRRQAIDDGAYAQEDFPRSASETVYLKVSMLYFDHVEFAFV